MSSLGLREFSVTRGSFCVGPITTTFGSGVVTALVGPNGSGKTTLMRGLLGLCGVSTGSCTVDGSAVVPGSRDFRQTVGYMPDDPNELLPELNVREYLTFVATCRSASLDRSGRRDAVSASLHAAARIASLLDLDLDGPRIMTFSHGMRSKTQLISALMTEPDVLLLDEPRNGLDPQALVHLEELIRELADRGTAVVVSSHDLDWVERMATSWVVISRGALVQAEPLLGGGDLRSQFLDLVRTS